MEDQSNEIETVEKKWDEIPIYEGLTIPEDIYENDLLLYRSILAKRALLKSYDEEINSPDTMVTDLLTDLRHLCDMIGLDFYSMESRAEQHYVAEIAGEEDESR